MALEFIIIVTIDIIDKTFLIEKYKLLKILDNIYGRILRTILAHQAPKSMGFSRQEYWSGLPYPTPGDLPNPGMECASPAVPALQKVSLPTEPPGKPIWKIGGCRSRQTWILTHM